MKLRRETVQRFWCPVCEAAPGKPCHDGDHEPRISNHRARVEKAERLIARTMAAGKAA